MNTKSNVVRVSNSFTRYEIRLLKQIIDEASSQEFRGRNHLMRYVENDNFPQLYRKLASMMEKADMLHRQARAGTPEKGEKAEKADKPEKAEKADKA